MKARRERERGGALLVTMILTASLLAGGAVLVSLQLKSTRSTELAKDRITSLYCAEAGLAAARQVVASNYAQWNASLCNPPAPEGTGTCVIGSVASQPSWLAAIDNDLDDDGAPDFVITLVDNRDDSPDDPTVDNDLQVFVVSTCTMFPDRLQVRELIRFNAGGNCYQAQLGGCGGNGNAN
jgi:hypothetical protein